MKYMKYGAVVAAGMVITMVVALVMIFGGSANLYCGDGNTASSQQPIVNVNFDYNGLSVKHLPMSGEQAKIVSTIFGVIQSRSKDFPSAQLHRVGVITIITGTQESALQNLIYGDRDSLGVFQQRRGWGTAPVRLNVAKSTNLFLDELVSLNGHKKVPAFSDGGHVIGYIYPNWQTGDYGLIAQSVQRSAFPGAYTQWVEQASRTTDRVLGTSSSTPVVAPVADCPEDPSGNQPVTVAGNWTTPIKKGEYSEGGSDSHWGWRAVHPVTGDRRFHSGVDMRASPGVQILAASNGRVVTAEYSSSWGNVVILEHTVKDASNKEVKYYTLYAHMTRFAPGLCAAGGHHIGPCLRSSVNVGQWIGDVGATGQVTGPHLHFNVCVSQQACRATPPGGKGTLDPEVFLHEQGVDIFPDSPSRVKK
jgi:murein DD-endopeptidase MepM/ murein hydrolase activator NlpD